MKKNDLLKIIALITMIVDHIGAVLFPTIIVFRVIGRISFPIYAYFISIGFTKTNNIKRYLLRLLVFAIISQIPYYILFKDGLNIIFTLLYGLLVIYLYENISKITSIYLLLISLLLPFLDYGFYGVCTIFIFYILREKKYYCIAMQVILTVILYQTKIQLISVLALPLIFKDWKTNITINKYFFYALYPIHLFILLIAKYFMN